MSIRVLAVLLPLTVAFMPARRPLRYRAARTAGNAIYVVPMLQAELDQMSGVLHTEEGDYVTAHSYFLEAYEGVDSLGDAQKPAAVNCLKYQMLCLVLGDKADDVTSILSGKAGVRGGACSA